jgi:hypothetical protein
VLLHAIAARLLEKEVLDGSEVEAMVTAFREGRPLPPSPAAVRNDFPPRPGPDTGKEKRVEDESPVPGLPPKPVLV